MFIKDRLNLGYKINTHSFSLQKDGMGLNYEGYGKEKGGGIKKKRICLKL